MLTCSWSRRLSASAIRSCAWSRALTAARPAREVARIRARDRGGLRRPALGLADQSLDMPARLPLDGKSVRSGSARGHSGKKAAGSSPLLDRPPHRAKQRLPQMARPVGVRRGPPRSSARWPPHRRDRAARPGRAQRTVMSIMAWSSTSMAASYQHVTTRPARLELRLRSDGADEHRPGPSGHGRRSRRSGLRQMAEDRGFEPLRAVNPTRFPSERHRPLGESSAEEATGRHGREEIAGRVPELGPGRRPGDWWGANPSPTLVRNPPCGGIMPNSPRAGRQQG